METSILIDTSVLVELLRGSSRARKLFGKWENTGIATSHINLFELYYGAYKSKKPGRTLPR